MQITGGGSLSVSSVTMNKGAFKNFTVDITGGTATTKITFKGKQPADSRFFIDDIVLTAAGFQLYLALLLLYLLVMFSLPLHLLLLLLQLQVLI